MKMIVGLGNIGPQYDGTRHNTGFMVVEQFAKSHDISIKTRKMNAKYGSGFVNNTKVMVVEPTTFMNDSGLAVRPLMDYFDVSIEDLIIVHDDMDLPVGSVRIRPKGSSGGQKGMKHIIACMGTDEIARIRIGVGHSKRGEHEEVPDWVLSPVAKADRELFDTAIDTAARAAEAWVTQPLDRVMSQYNLKVKPEGEKEE